MVALFTLVCLGVFVRLHNAMHINDPVPLIEKSRV